MRPDRGEVRVRVKANAAPGSFYIQVSARTNRMTGVGWDRWDAMGCDGMDWYLGRELAQDVVPEKASGVFHCELGLGVRIWKSGTKVKALPSDLHLPFHPFTLPASHVGPGKVRIPRAEGHRRPLRLGTYLPRQ